MLECRSVSQMYNTTPILVDVSIAIAPGEIHQISGPSGGGKTTLLRVLSLLEAPTAGTVWLDERKYCARDLFSRQTWSENAGFRQHVTLVSQQIFLWPHLTCRVNIEAVGGHADEYAPLAERLNVSKCLDRYPNQVSVGQRQRIAIIRSIATRPKYLILDEVTSALDEQMSAIVTDLFSGLSRSNTGIIIVTHRKHAWQTANVHRWWIEHGRLTCKT
jgi:ABC-type polar amino acid transport system ATPase subunit